jgi:hypothetical protein
MYRGVCAVAREYYSCILFKIVAVQVKPRENMGEIHKDDGR